MKKAVTLPVGTQLTFDDLIALDQVSEEQQTEYQQFVFGVMSGDDFEKKLLTKAEAADNLFTITNPRENY